MEGFFAVHRLLPAFAIAYVLLVLPANGQLITPCTASALATFSPCINFFTNNSLNGTSPTADCCKSLKTVVNNGTDCLCLIATGSVPFRIPINRTLVLSLPRACNMPGVPLQCKASGAPTPAASGAPALAPAPGPSGSVPAPSSQLTPAPTVSALPLPVSPTLAPEAETTPALNPPSPAVSSGTPTTNTGNRQSVTPSAASSQSSSPVFLLFMLGAIAFKYC